MGWLWGSTKPKTADAPHSESAISESPSAPPPPEPMQQQLTREEQANEDLRQFMRDIEADFSNARSERIQSRESGVLKHTTPLPDDISPDSLYPSQIHCRSAFDYAMFCQSFGGQFVNVYRYGSFRSCSNHWNDFWLCMRTRQWPEQERVKSIKDHYRNKAIKYKTGPSSEDIWKVRSEPVKDAFQDNLEELERKIEQWKKANADSPDPWADSNGYTFKGSSSE
jgi:hypothetical protein